MKRDLRLTILKYFSKLNASTSETAANEWLSKQHDDLGTIRRALIELIETDLMAISEMDKFSAVSWLKTNLDTKTVALTADKDKRDKKSSRRLIEKVEAFSEIPKIRLFVTLQGVMFVNEQARMKNAKYYRVLSLVLSIVLPPVISTLVTTWAIATNNSGCNEKNKEVVLTDFNPSESSDSIEFIKNTKPND